MPSLTRGHCHFQGSERAVSAHAQGFLGGSGNAASRRTLPSQNPRRRQHLQCRQTSRGAWAAGTFGRAATRVRAPWLTTQCSCSQGSWRSGPQTEQRRRCAGTSFRASLRTSAVLSRGRRAQSRVLTATVLARANPSNMLISLIDIGISCGKLPRIRHLNCDGWECICSLVGLNGCISPFGETTLYGSTSTVKLFGAGAGRYLKALSV